MGMQFPFDSLPEGALLSLAQRGDAAACEVLWRRLLPHLERRVRGLCGDPHAAEDLLAETRLRLLRELPHLAPGSHLRAWACRVLLNLRHDGLRRQMRGPLARLDEGAEGRVPAPTEAGPEPTALRRDADCRRHHALADALTHLSQVHPDQAAAVVAHHFDGMEFNRMQGNAATWRSRNRRGLTWLRRYLVHHHPHVCELDVIEADSGAPSEPSRREFGRTGRRVGASEAPNHRRPPVGSDCANRHHRRDAGD